MFSKSNLSKMGIAAAIIAVGSMATVDLAEAKRGDGARRGGGNTVTKQARNNNRQAQQVRRNKKDRRNARNVALAVGTIAAIAIANSQRDKFRNRDVHVSHNNNFRNNWRGRGNGFDGRRGNIDRFCVAVAKTRHGRGHRIGGIRAKAHGRRACRKAVNRCSSKLYNRRQSRGRNPHAECVVVRRNGGRFSRR